MRINEVTCTKGSWCSYSGQGQAGVRWVERTPGSLSETPCHTAALWRQADLCANRHSSSGTTWLTTLGKKAALGSLTLQMSNIPLNLPPVRNRHLTHHCSMEAKLGCPGPPPPRPRTSTLSPLQRPPPDSCVHSTHLLSTCSNSPAPGRRSQNHTLVEEKDTE